VADWLDRRGCFVYTCAMGGSGRLLTESLSPSDAHDAALQALSVEVAKNESRILEAFDLKET